MFPRSPSKLNVERAAQSLLTMWIGRCEPGIYRQAGARVKLVCLSRGVDGMKGVEECRC